MRKLLLLLLLLSLLSTYACSNAVQNQEESVASESISETTSIASSEDSECDGVIEDNFKAGYIQFVGSAYGPFQGENGYNYPDVARETKYGKNIEFIESYEDYISFCEETKFSPGEEFTEEFFDTNSVIFSFFVDGSSSPEYMIKSIYADEDRNVTIIVKYLTHGGGDAAVQHTTLAAKVKKSDLNNVKSITFEYETVFLFGGYTESAKPEGGKELNFKTQVFDGRIENSNHTRMSSLDPYPTIVQCPETALNYNEFSEIMKRYVSDSDSTEFTDYISTLDEDCFEENIVLFYSYSCKYDGCFVAINGVTDYNEYLTIDLEINDKSATVFEDSEKILLLEIPKQEWQLGLSFKVNYKYLGYRYSGELSDIDYTSRVIKIDVDTKNPKNMALEDLDYSEGMRAALDKESMLYILTTNYYLKEPFNDELSDYLAQFDDEFFETHALLISEKIFVDKGEQVEVTGVYRGKQRYTSTIEILLGVTIDDSVKPSTNENLDCYLCFAIIDKNEMVGMETSCDVKLK